jgi:hypothetical protein
MLHWRHNKGGTMRLNLFVLLLLAGCAVLTPLDVRNQGVRSEFKSAKAPRAVANCIARNADDAKRGTLQATVREGHSGGAYDIHVFKPGIGYVLTAEVLPAADGSAIATWFMPHLGTNVSPELMRGCE